MLTHLDLCSGIGGFAIAARWAGFQTIGFSEIDPYCCALLKEKWPLVKNYGDLRRADFSRLRGGVTVISAGVPCQPASLAGKRGGARDNRWLWPAVLDVVQSVKPAWCIFENPDGILTLGEFADTLARLGTLGYEVRAFRVSANSIGAMHRRYRIFIVCHAAGARLPSRTCGASGTLWDRARLQEPERRGDDAQAVANRSCQLFNGGGKPGQGRWTEPPDGSQALADADGAGWREQCGSEPVCPQQPESERDLRRQPLAQVRRVADGLPQRLDPDFWRTAQMPHPLSRGEKHRAARLKALGNAVVPQQAYPFLEAIARGLVPL